MKTTRYLLLLLLAMAAFKVQAQSMQAYRDTVKDGYNFWLYTPAATDSAETGKPVVIFLHGASLCGNDLDRVRRYGTLDAVEKGRELDAYVIAPQNPGGSWKPEKLMNVLQWVQQNHQTDSNRVYVMGMSLGGYGTIDFAATYPDKIAAAMAFCGGGTVKDYSGLTEMPLWIVHGTADRAVSVRESDKVVEAMKRSGGTDRLIYNRVPGMNHGGPARIFYLKQSYDWLFEHSLADPERPANRDYCITGDALRSAYDGLKMGTRSYATRSSRQRSRSYGSRSRSYRSRPAARAARTSSRSAATRKRTGKS